MRRSARSKHPRMAPEVAEFNATSRRAEELTERQSEVFLFVVRYHRLTDDGCPASVVANKLKIHHQAARDHFAALHRKGWLLTDSSPAIPRRRYLTRGERNR